MSNDQGVALQPRNFSTSPGISFAGTIVGVICVAFAVGAAVSCVRLNSVAKIAVISQSFSIRASASARC